MEAREDGVYITYVPSAGADPVVKKLLGSTAELLWTNPSVQSQGTIVAACDWSKYNKIIILACTYYGLITSRYIQCCDIGISTTGWNIGSSNGTTRKVTFNDGYITMYVTDTTHNWDSYNIPLKIWGVYEETDMFTYP